VATLNAPLGLFGSIEIRRRRISCRVRYKTTFSDPAYPVEIRKEAANTCIHSLKTTTIRINIRKTGEDGKINAVPYGDPDGVIPVKYDKDKNNKYDFEEDFLNYDCDPPKSDLYFDRNNNGVPDDIEDDAYPDYPMYPVTISPASDTCGRIPGPGNGLMMLCLPENTLPVPVTGSSFRMDQQVRQRGFRVFICMVRYDIFPKLSLTLGGIYEGSEKNSYQMTYQDTSPAGLIYAPERPSTCTP